MGIVSLRSYQFEGYWLRMGGYVVGAKVCGNEPSIYLFINRLFLFRVNLILIQISG